MGDKLMTLEWVIGGWTNAFVKRDYLNMGKSRKAKRRAEAPFL